MDAVLVKLEIPPRRYEQLVNLATTRQLSVGEVAQMAISEWLEDQARLERARTLMHELGQGLAHGQPPHHVARDHDAYLYSRE